MFSMSLSILMDADESIRGFNAIYRRAFDNMPKDKIVGLEEREVSYLPLSHIAGSVGIFGGLGHPDNVCSTVYFAFPDALQGSIGQTLNEVQPTMLIAVPRVWEKFEAGLRGAMEANPALKKAPGSAVLGALGLSKVKLGQVGAAPIGDETLKFF